jgi:hypothetical protein
MQVTPAECPSSVVKQLPFTRFHALREQSELAEISLFWPFWRQVIHPKEEWNFHLMQTIMAREGSTMAAVFQVPF